MKLLAAFLSLLLTAQAFGQPIPLSTAPAAEGSADVEFSTSPITVTAPRESPEVARLKVARGTGAVAAAGGGGLMIYSMLFAAGGPFTLAAGLLLLGGLTAYLAHRRLHGHDDFSPGPPPRRPDSPTASK